MQDLARVLTLLAEVTGLDQFYIASKEAGYWLSLSVMLRALAAFWMVGCTLVFSVRAVRLLLPGLGLPLRWTCIMGAGTWVSTMGFHALRGLGLFNLPAAVLACTALGAVAVLGGAHHAPWRWAMHREWRAVRAVLRLFKLGKYSFVTALFAAYVLLQAVRSLIIPPLGWDTLTYHGPRAVLWLQSGQFTFDPGPGPFDLYRHFLSGGEVLMAWAMLPFHSDLFANLATIALWIGVGAATWSLARALSLREPFAATSAGLTMLVPALALEMNTGYVEAPLNFALLLGIALAIQCLRRPTSPTAGRLAVASAMALGIAMGIKLPGAPPGAIVLAALLVRFLFVSRLKPLERLGVVALGAFAAALPLLPFMYQAFRETGYPLSPMPIMLLGLTLGVSSPSMQWYLERPLLVPYTWDTETAALRLVFSGIGNVHEYMGPSLGVMALLPLCTSLVGLAVIARRRPLIAVVMAGAMLAPWLTHFSRNLSVSRLFWAVSVARYLIVLMAMAIPVSFAWCRAESALAQTYRRILIVIALWAATSALRHGVPNWEVRELLIVGLSCLALGTVIWVVFSRPRSRAKLAATLPWRRTALCALIAALCCSALQLRRDQTRPLAATQSFALHNSPRHFYINSLALVDEPDVQHRIAVTSGPSQNADNWFSYFFFGKRFQNTISYVPPTVDAGVAHFGPYGDFDRRIDRAHWLERIRARRITEVLSFTPQSIEMFWMSELPDRFERLDGGGDWALFRVR